MRQPAPATAPSTMIRPVRRRPGPVRDADVPQASTPAPPRPDGRLPGSGPGVLQLQRAYGNRYVQQVVHRSRRPDLPAPPIQAELLVGPADDVNEREADRVADQVVGKAGPPAPVPVGPVVSAGLTPTISRRASGDPGAAHPAVTAGPGLESAVGALHRAGQALPTDVRTDFEDAFGTDLSAVRVHTGGDAARLNRDLGAQAFTHGSDVFFGAGHYAPRTPAGRWLLAHELTHVVQQEAHEGPIQRKMSWQNTAWGDAKKAWSSTGGGRGVLFVTDDAADDPVVVKTGESASAEAVLAANLHSMAGGAGDWRVEAPGVRTIDATEGARIKDGVRFLIWGDDRARRIVADVDQPGAMVFDYARGEEFKDLVQGSPKHSEKTLVPGQRELRKSSPFKLFLDPGFMTSAGRFTVIDIFTANFDRLTALWNPENFKIDKTGQTILLIDNVYMSNDVAFKTITNPRYTLTSDSSFQSWTGNQWVQKLHVGDYKGIADGIIATIKTAMANGAMPVRAEDTATVGRALDESKGALVAGLSQGMKVLYSMLGRLDEATQGVATADRDEVTTSVKRRLGFLFT
jgi:Domain of unknown function (DUF4157)